jgi:ABC-type lipoprotein release transport system permease subunit
MNQHARILEFALSSLLRRKFRNSMIVLAYSLNVFLLFSILFLTDALQNEAAQILKGSPELIVQKLKGGRHDLIPEVYGGEIRGIRGVKAVTPRYWGYYYDPPTKGNYTLMAGDDPPPEIASMVEGSFCEAICKIGKRQGKMLPCIIGQGVADARFIGLDDIIPIKGSGGDLHILRVAGIFKSESAILTNDLIVLGAGDIKTIFEIPNGMATDLAIRIRNVKEVNIVSRKIQERLPDVRIISREQILSTYEALFGWRSGLTVALMIGSIAAFAIFAWGKAAGLSAEERKEIGTLKAVGWETSDVLELKFWEGFVISIISFLTGLIFAHVHVFFFGGALFVPVLRGWSVLFPVFHPLPHIDFHMILVILFFTVAPYIMATIVPSWRTAITDPDMAMR